MSGPTAIRVEMLGGLRVLHDGRELPELRQHRTLGALLIYVAVERRVARDAALALFWPESDTENARHALRQALYRLRNIFGDNGWLIVLGDELVAGELLTCDVGDFDAAVRSSDFAAAAAFYRGPFLQSVHLADVQPWEQWCDLQRMRLARAYRVSCRTWVDACLREDDLQGALAAAHAWVTPDPTDDEAQHRLIELLVRVGDRTDAIRQYERYERLLRAEALTPLDETTALFRSLLSEPPRDTQPVSVRYAATAPASGLDVNSRDASVRWGIHGTRSIGFATLMAAFTQTDFRRAHYIAAALTVGVLAGVTMWAAAKPHGFDDGTSANEPYERGRIAMLPCIQDPADATPDFVGIGIMDQLIRELSRLETVTPVARNSVLKIANLERNYGRIAAQLSVGTIIDCAIRRQGTRLRVSFQVVNTGTMATLGPLYTRDLEQLFGSEASIAHDIARYVNPTNVHASVPRVKREVAQEAWLDYLQGRQFTGNTEVLLQRAITHFERAITAEPTFALAHAGLADAVTALGTLGLWAPREARDSARAAAQRALTLDDQLPEAFAALAAVRFWFDWDWGAAEDAFKRAQDLQPASTAARANYGAFLVAMRRFDEALQLMEENARVDPLNWNAHRMIAWVHHMAGRQDDAIRQFHANKIRFPESKGLLLAWTYHAKGMHAEALIAAKEAETQLGEDPWLRTSLAFVRAAAGQRDAATKMLDELSVLRQRRYVDPRNVAILRAVLGDTARALDELESSYQLGAPEMVFLGNETAPFHAPFRRSPRYAALVQKLRFPF